jgi:hypothetical protein
MAAILTEVLRDKERAAEATADGVTMLVEQYYNADTSLFWIFGDKAKRTDPEGWKIEQNREELLNELSARGFDPDAPIWSPSYPYRCTFCQRTLREVSLYLVVGYGYQVCEEHKRDFTPLKPLISER